MPKESAPWPCGHFLHCTSLAGLRPASELGARGGSAELQLSAGNLNRLYPEVVASRFALQATSAPLVLRRLGILLHPPE